MADKKCPHYGAEMSPYHHSDMTGKVTRRYACARGGICKRERMVKELARRRAA